MREKKLATYRSKRHFERTPEPLPTGKQGSKKPIFVVQKHKASHLHYDFRIEIGGVLKSWAVPKGPPLKVGEKRLAVETEDHPLDYATFEGEIPEGNYGAGTVEIWDHGTFLNLKERAGKPVPLWLCYQEGKIEIYLDGEKLQGPYALIQTNLPPGKKQWLLLKMKRDEPA